MAWRRWFVGLLAGVLALTVVLISVHGVHGESQKQYTEPVIRVALLQEAPEVTFRLNGTYELINRATGNVIAKVITGDTGDTWAVEDRKSVV